MWIEKPSNDFSEYTEKKTNDTNDTFKQWTFLLADTKDHSIHYQKEQQQTKLEKWKVKGW